MFCPLISAALAPESAVAGRLGDAGPRNTPWPLKSRSSFASECSHPGTNGRSGESSKMSWPWRSPPSARTDAAPPARGRRRRRRGPKSPAPARNRSRRRRVLLGKVVVRDGTAAEREEEGMSAWVSARSNATATEGRGRRPALRITGGERTFRVLLRSRPGASRSAGVIFGRVASRSRGSVPVGVRRARAFHIRTVLCCSESHPPREKEPLRRREHAGAVSPGHEVADVLSRRGRSC